MSISHIIIQNFRNISEISWNPDPRVNVIIGGNGQGKTSLLEAVYFLNHLASFRSSKAQELIQFGQASFQLGLEGSDHLALRVSFGSDTRRQTKNGKAVTPKIFRLSYRTVIFSPDSLATIKQGPELRRELIDQALMQVDADYEQMLSDYQRVLRQRSSCLKSMRDQKLPLNQGQQILESLNPYFVELGKEVTTRRLSYLGKVEPLFKETLGQVLGCEVQKTMEYIGRRGPWSFDAARSQVKDRLMEEVANPERQRLEFQQGITLSGPHRDDLIFLLHGREARVFGSQGQQRAVILAFKIAEIMYHIRVLKSFPVLLLDDVMSELDDNRRSFLIGFLKKTESQVMLTTTDQAHALGEGRRFFVEDGKIS